MAIELNSALIRSLGMTLVHSLWEGLVIFFLVFFILSLAGRSNARLRYVVLVSGHFMLLAAFIATWFITYHQNLETALKSLNKAYSQVSGLVSTSSLAIKTADYTTTINQYLEPIYPALAIGWIMGFIFMLIRMTGGLYLSYRIMNKDVILPDPWLLKLFEKAKTRLMVRGTLNLRMTARQISPMVIGIIKPCIIFPAAILSGLNAEQVEAILVHELAHIRRYDHVVIIMQAIINRILFFHPVAWYFSAEINRERENCCDDLVIKTFPNPINYIKALTMIQELNMDGQVPANALMGRSKRLLGRVKRLLKTEKRHAPVFRMAVIFLLLTALGIAAVTIASAGNPGTRKSLENFFVSDPYSVADTIKTTKHEKTAVKPGSTENSKKKKELNEAARKLEKAHLEMQKAQIELEKAREEFMRAGGRMRHDLADLSDDQKRQMDEQMRESGEHMRAMELHRRAMEDIRHRSQDDIRRSIEKMHIDSMVHHDMKREMMANAKKHDAAPGHSTGNGTD